ncbi:MAG: sigma 54-interacting transcriptional regulator [Candidatus Rokubacteria bacterium]|nr:sigma 54-interacting transcriptional regulator [Candidatus Rokubacteria bacterium]
MGARMNPLAELVGESPGIAAVRETIGRLLQRHSDARRLPPILIQGETGTGKGLVARAIHRAGPRAAGPFVDVNCAAIPDTLLEAEMFGFERGAFTDARQAKRGLFQAAHRGTIFLDEVGLLPEGLQAKLLKVLEEQSVRRLGSTRSEPVDVWVLTATSEDLLGAIRGRRFREDLYHRLAVLTLWLPPIRERGGDLLVLAEHFLARACGDYELAGKRLSAEARGALRAYRWPGNVRELANVMERVALLGEGAEVTAAQLGLPGARPVEAGAAPPVDAAVPLEVAVGSVERAHLVEALRETSWNISRAAARLGIPRNTLRYRIEKHGLRPPGSAAAPSPESRRLAPARPARPSRVAETPAAYTVTAAPVPAAAAPGPVTPPPGVRWERRRLTLLRAALDVPAATDPTAELSRASEILVEKVQSFGGRIEELGSAGIVAAFGLEPVEDAPRRAALAAVAILKAAERGGGGEVEGVRIKVGIHIGQVMLGRIGDASMIDQDAKRGAWVVLDELVERAEPNTVLASGAAAPFLDRRFELQPMGSLERTPGHAYRLGGLERAGLRLGGRLARFVGRQQDLAQLGSRLESALRGQGQVVGIAGEAGIGKSRLLFEFRQRLADQPVTYLEGHCVSYGSAIPYLPVLDVLRMSCGITDTDGPELMRGKIHRGLEGAGMDPAGTAPYLFQLLGLKDGTDRLAELSPEVVKARTFEILRQMSLGHSQETPLVIVVEDLQWTDKTSEEYLASLAESVAGARILLIATYRPGYRPPWIEKSYATQTALQPLAPEDSLSLLRSVLGVGEVAGALVERILAKAEGNPFFLEELARVVREEGGLLATLAVPDTIEEVLLARIDRLPLEEQHLLRAAAVIGRHVPVPLVGAVADLPDETLRRALQALLAAEFLYETGASPELEYTFRHTLTQEVAYGGLLPDQRRALHARIVEAVERLYADRLSEHVEHLAHHAFRAEAWERALTYLRQAGARAAARSAHREAVAYLGQALVALEHLPETRDTIAQAIDVRFDLRNSLHPLGELGRILDYLREARILAESLGEERRLGWVSSYMTQYFRLMGDLDHAIESGERALGFADALGDFALQVATNTHLGPAYAALGDYRRAIKVLRKNVESVRGDLARERFHLAGLPYVFSLANLVSCLAELGEFAEGIARGEEAIRVAEAADDPHSLIFAYFSVGTLSLLRGEFHEAIRVLQRGLDLCRAWSVALMVPAAASSLGFAYALSGRFAEAMPLLEEAVAQADSMGLMARHSIFLLRKSEADLLAGCVDDALRLADRALELARERRERGHEAYALRLLGEVAARRDPPDVERALASYRQAVALADELGMRPLLARCRLGLGMLYRRLGDRPSADQHLAAATAFFRDMGMRFWLERIQQD